MYQEKYIRDNNTNYIVIDSEQELKEMSYSMNMLVKNKIPVLLPASTRVINNSVSYYYDISSKQPFHKVYEANTINYNDIVITIKNLYQLEKNIHEYFLELDHVILNPKFIYTNINEKKFYFIYYPYTQKTYSDSMKELFEYILEHLDHEDKSNVIAAYGLYQKVLLQDVSAQVLMEYINEIQKDKNLCEQEELQKETPKEEAYPIKEEIYEENKKENKNNISFPNINIIKFIPLFFSIILGIGLIFPQYKIIRINFFFSMILILISVVLYWGLDHYEQPPQKENEADIFEETQLLSNDIFKEKKISVPKLILLDKEENETDSRIELKNMPCILGSSDAQCNYVIEDRTISRCHVKFIKDQDTEEFFIEDLHSTNGTFLNNNQIMPDQTVKIEDGDVLRMAIKAYRFGTN